MTPRRRLTPQMRRHEIVTVAARLFAAQAYDDVVMDNVAAASEVSRALLYRYFPSKRDLFAAVYRQAADRLLEVSMIHRDQPLLPQIEAGLDAHFDYFLANATTVLTANRTLAGDPVVQAIISDELDELRRRVLAVTSLHEPSRAAVGQVLMSWLVFVRVMAVEWLTQQSCSRDQLRGICLGALLGALQPIIDLDELSA